MKTSYKLQPIIDLKNESIFGYEVLSYDRNISKYPSAVMVLRHLSRFEEKNTAVFINITSEEISSKTFENEFLKELSVSSIDPSNIILEINENTSVKQLKDAISLFITLKGCGVKIALDDFGIQHSTLDLIYNLQLDYLKIDKEIIQNSLHSRDNRSMLQFCINVSHGIGCKVIAEGIERFDQLHYLIEEEVDFGQGFLFSAPSMKNSNEPVDAAIPYPKSFVYL